MFSTRVANPRLLRSPVAGILERLSHVPFFVQFCPDVIVVARKEAAPARLAAGRPPRSVDARSGEPAQSAQQALGK
jgi:hypothetical protein